MLYLFKDSYKEIIIRKPEKGRIFGVTVGFGVQGFCRFDGVLEEDLDHKVYCF